MSILYGITSVVAILFMSVFMFIGIWLFIIALKSYRQIKYKNYILEKIHEKLDILSKNKDSSNKDFWDLSEDIRNSSSVDNIENFDKLND